MTTGRLDPKLRTVGELFGEEGVVYTIPAYQRNYAWRAEQIEQLISDVHSAMDDGEDGYFLGNLIVKARGASTRDFEVVDGQQRLTTLYMLLIAVDDHAGSSMHGDEAAHLRYASRPRATEALRRIAGGMARHAARTLDTASEDAGILEGFNVIHQFMDQHPDLRAGESRRQFASFLRSKVRVVRAALPPGTDLNRYFEIMNTRGQQLQQVDIVKARLMSRLRDERDRACFAWIWDACADMDSYVQMSLTQGDTGKRTRVFGDDWTWLAVDSFGDLRDIDTDGSAESDAHAALAAEGARSLEGALTTYARLGEPAWEEDPDNVRFRSTIQFPAFLLNVLKVATRDSDEVEGQLDDRQLIKRFEDAVKVAGRAGEERWACEFAFTLLRCRNLFDAFILKRQYTATNGEDGDWSVCRMVRRTSRQRSIPGYVSTFSRRAMSAEAPQGDDEDADDATWDALLLESMLRVTYTSPRTMHWISKLLSYLFASDPRTIDGAEVSAVLRDYARSKTREAFFLGEQPRGFDVNRIVFTYLDYLLVKDGGPTEFRFSFRNSIEHFYPQSPDEQQSGAEVSAECLNLLGNLALVSVGANSKFSNSLPLAKALNFGPTIVAQSPKLQRMAAITEGDRSWGDDQVRRHHDEVVGILAEDIGVADR